MIKAMTEYQILADLEPTAKVRQSLFQLGDFRLHSGAKSFFKIECDALTDTDIECLARLAVDRVPPFGEVMGVPRGGLRLAEALKPYRRPHCPRVLIVDDVYTSGDSIRRQAEHAQRQFKCSSEQLRGLVIFAREPIEHPWVRAIFQITSPTNE